MGRGFGVEVVVVAVEAVAGGDAVGLVSSPRETEDELGLRDNDDKGGIYKKKDIACVTRKDDCLEARREAMLHGNDNPGKRQCCLRGGKESEDTG